MLSNKPVLRISELQKDGRIIYSSNIEIPGQRMEKTVTYDQYLIWKNQIEKYHTIDFDIQQMLAFNLFDYATTRWKSNIVRVSLSRYSIGVQIDPKAGRGSAPNDDWHSMDKAVRFLFSSLVKEIKFSEGYGLGPQLNYELKESRLGRILHIIIPSRKRKLIDIQRPTKKGVFLPDTYLLPLNQKSFDLMALGGKEYSTLITEISEIPGIESINVNEQYIVAVLGLAFERNKHEIDMAIQEVLKRRIVNLFIGGDDLFLELNPWMYK
jgi:hypothetical protein